MKRPETVFFPKVYDRYCHMLNTSRPYILKGRVVEDFTALTLTVHWIGVLDKYRGNGSYKVDSGTP